MEKELLFITVLGKDKKGIVARVSGYLYDKAINIEDINQRIMGDGFFVMTMLVNMKGSNASLETITREMEDIAAALEVKIQVQHENIFKMMHRV